MSVLSVLFMGIGAVSVLFLLVFAAELLAGRRGGFNSPPLSLRRENLRGLALAAIINLGLILVFLAIGRSLDYGTLIITSSYCFGLVLCIINLVYPVQRSMERHGPNAVRYLLLFLAIIAGALIGTLLCNILFALLLGRQVFGGSFVAELSFNMGLALAIGAGRLIYELVKAGMNLRLKEKEVEVQRLQQMKTRAELEALQSKINPHFLYNALNSIAGLVHSQPEKAEAMVLSLSRFFRSSIGSRERAYTSVQEELDIVRAYLDIEKVRFGRQLEFRLKAENGTGAFLLPRFLLQPLVENAVKHGVNRLDGKGCIEIDVRMAGDNLRLCVHDNGPAFGDDLSGGYGLQSTHDKLELLLPGRYELHASDEPRKQLCITIFEPVTDEQALHNLVS